MMQTLRVAIIDYEMGNLYSVKRACECVGLNPLVTSEKSVLLGADALILPGVGAFGDAMESLKKRDLLFPIKDFIARGKPFMGICLGMQLLFSESEEFGSHEGMDVIRGSVVRFPSNDRDGRKIKIPHVGWCRLYKPVPSGGWNHSPLRGINDGEYVYFVHSYHVVPENKDVVLSRSSYEGIDFCSSVLQKNIFACQFHPEKSLGVGLKIYANWASLWTMATRT
jgi:imidazole glycerol-phosphate synthase subunit HisH